MKKQWKSLAPGIREDKYGIEIRASRGTGANKKTDYERAESGTSIKTLKARQCEMRGALLKKHPAAKRGTFAADVQQYLPAVKSLATYAEREYHMSLWCAEFGSRSRGTIKTHEISAVLQKWLATGASPYTILNKRNALMNLWTVLDGSAAPNPVDESFAPATPTLTANDIPWPTIDKVLDALENRGQGVKGVKRGTVSKTKIRLHVIAYTGLPHALLKQVKPEHIHWDDETIDVMKRRKGSGVDQRRMSLSVEALEALRAFDEHDCYGGFSNSSMTKTWRRAWKWVHPNWPKDQRIPYPYRLRHSFAVAITQKTGDEKGVAQLLMHSPSSNATRRYTQGAVPERMRVNVAAFSEQRAKLLDAAKRRQKTLAS